MRRVVAGGLMLWWAGLVAAVELPDAGFFELEINGRNNAQLTPVQFLNGMVVTNLVALKSYPLVKEKLRPKQDVALVELCPANDCVVGVDIERALLRIVLPDDYFVKQALGLKRGVVDGRPASNSRGVHLNYDVIHADNDLGIQNNSALLQLSAYQGDWSFRHNHLWRDNPSNQGWLRLSTTLEYADAANLSIYSAGDNITQGTNFNLPTGFLGVQIRSDYNLKPSLITYAQPRFETVLAQESTAQLFVNGDLFAEQEALPGLLESGDIPASVGRNNVQVRVTDAQGRERLIAAPFYVAPQVLRKGLSNYSLQLGKVRSSDFVDRIRYDQSFVSTHYLYGVTDRINVGFFAELTEQYSNWGGKWVAKSDRFGVFDLEVAANLQSSSETRWSGLVSYDYMTRNFLLNLNSRYREEGFQQLGTFDADVRLENSLSIGVFLGTQLDLTLNAADIRNHDRSERSRWSFAVGKNFNRWGRVSLRLGETRSDTTQTEQQISLTYALPLGRHFRSNSFVGRTERETSQSDAVQTRLSYSDHQNNGQSRIAEIAASSFDESDAYSARLAGRFERFEASATVIEDEAGFNYQASVAGSLIKLDGAPFIASRKLRNAFLLVDSDLPELPVTLQNRGRRKTNQKGLSVYDNLTSHQLFTLDLNTRALPITHTVREPQKQVAIGREQGGFARFVVEPVRAVQFNLRSEEGLPIKAGSVLHSGSEQAAVVSAGGDVYLDHHDRPVYFWVGQPEQGCRVFVPPSAPSQVITDLGSLTCAGENPPVALAQAQRGTELSSLVYLAKANGVPLVAGSLVYDGTKLLGAVGLQGEIILANRFVKPVLTYQNPLKGRAQKTAHVIAQTTLQ